MIESYRPYSAYYTLYPINEEEPPLPPINPSLEELVLIGLQKTENDPQFIVIFLSEFNDLFDTSIQEIQDLLREEVLIPVLHQVQSYPKLDLERTQLIASVLDCISRQFEILVDQPDVENLLLLKDYPLLKEIIFIFRSSHEKKFYEKLCASPFFEKVALNQNLLFRLETLIQIDPDTRPNYKGYLESFLDCFNQILSMSEEKIHCLMEKQLLFPLLFKLQTMKAVGNSKKAVILQFMDFLLSKNKLDVQEDLEKIRAIFERDLGKKTGVFSKLEKRSAFQKDLDGFLTPDVSLEKFSLLLHDLPGIGMDKDSACQFLEEVKERFFYLDSIKSLVTGI